MATRPDFVGEMSQAGAMIRHQGIGRWWAAVDKNRWPDGDYFEKNIEQNWVDDYGDRRQEIVFIGLKEEMDEEVIRAKLDSALILDYFHNQEKFLKLHDPFPKWFN